MVGLIFLQITNNSNVSERVQNVSGLLFFVASQLSFNAAFPVVQVCRHQLFWRLLFVLRTEHDAMYSTQEDTLRNCPRCLWTIHKADHEQV